MMAFLVANMPLTGELVFLAVLVILVLSWITIRYWSRKDSQPLVARVSIHCPTCGTILPADAPQGLCPKCLLGGRLDGHHVHFGLDSDRPAARRTTPGAAPAEEATGPHRESFTAPSPVELAVHFPQLEVLELLGQGGMGAVYKARQTKLDRLVALKILPTAASRDAAFAERFNREARALAQLNHPGIVAVHDFGQAEDFYYFIMEFVDGVNLRQALRTGPLPSEEALKLVPQICEALEYAHQEGVVHRDIKPENILLDRRGRVKIADFGLAKLLDNPAAGGHLTGTHQVMGTPHYMAPEQMEKPQTVDHRADIYSLGVVFYEMLTGELPLGRFAPPSERAAVNIGLDEVVMRALEKDPAERYQRISQVKIDLESLAKIAHNLNKPLDSLARVGLLAVALLASVLLVLVVRPAAVAAFGEGHSVPALIGIMSVSVLGCGLAFWQFTAKYRRAQHYMSPGVHSSEHEAIVVPVRSSSEHASSAPRRLITWTLLCAALYLVLWLPAGSASSEYLGVIDRYLWPYHSVNKSTVTLIPKSDCYPRIILVEEQEIGGNGTTDNWPTWANSPSVPLPGCQRWKTTVSVPNRDYSPEFVLDFLTLEVSSKGSHYRQRSSRAGPIDRTDVVNLIDDYDETRKGVRYSNAILQRLQTTQRDQLLREAAEVAAIIQECQEPHLGLTQNYPSLKGKLDYIVRSRKEQAGEQNYPFAEHTAAETNQVGPSFSINWLGIPVSLLVWLVGLWLLRPSAVAHSSNQAPASRSLVGQFLTYFWSQPEASRNLPAVHQTAQYPADSINLDQDLKGGQTVPLQAELERKVRWSGTELLLIGSLESLGFLLGLLGLLYEGWVARHKATIYFSGFELFSLPYCLFGLTKGVLTLYAGVAMLRFSSYRWAMIGSIAAMIPVSIACLLGFPAGLWAVNILARRDVKAAFAQKKKGDESVAPSESALV